LNHHVTNYFLYQKRFWRYHQTIYQYHALTADENERSERNQARKWCSEKSQEYLQNLVY
jgi:hypothetical protein